MNCKKILALLLAVLLLLTASLTSCKRDKENDDEAQSDTASDIQSAPDGQNILISDKGELKFKIVLAENLPVETEKTIIELGKIISKYSGTTFKAFETADVRNYNAETKY